MGDSNTLMKFCVVYIEYNVVLHDRNEVSTVDKARTRKVGHCGELCQSFSDIINYNTFQTIQYSEISYQVDLK